MIAKKDRLCYDKSAGGFPADFLWGGIALIQKLLWVFFISMVPVIELRGAIPVGAAMGLPFWLNYLVCVVGNVLPVPFLILFSEKVLTWCTKIPKIGRLFQKIIDKGQKKTAKIGRYELLSLMLFVAFPIPGTGAWSGSLVAALLHLPVKKASLAITLGVLLCGLIMGAVSWGVFDVVLSWF